jgi:hypothetical protein
MFVRFRSRLTLGRCAWSIDHSVHPARWGHAEAERGQINPGKYHFAARRRLHENHDALRDLLHSCVASLLIDFWLDEPRQVAQRLLPAKVAGIRWNDIWQAFLNDV